ncbi:alkylation response protein AidB-like acyl-CoA dehydrogenase [Paucimonas lemoignei]|uniref:Dibenzothiophene monooxygenase n=1 Tax=Paucimonas lemoignei TaxID=29443 RepID=A0A4R3HWL3_PAULE|nr:acyl-CoA dehydrogenase family protein [Paucimonas lemoignei]TCS36641.1 alkylation response protein AidB-like acyl-CoA dehydrogenase [Paucimonas lemoignei]
MGNLPNLSELQQQAAGSEHGKPHHLFHRDFGALTEAVERTASVLALTAPERDRQGGTAWAERQALRDSGLLTLAVPAAFGGPEASWPFIYRVIRRFAEVDSSLAHLFAFQHLQVASIILFANPVQKARYLGGTVSEGWFWGNGTNSLGNQVRLVWREEGGYYELSGTKTFCSGATGSDMLNVTAPHPERPDERVFFAIPTKRAGIHVLDDWDNLGQRQTDSGSVIFDNVRVERDEVLGPPGTAGTPRATLRTLVSQVILTEIYIGNAQGALQNAWKYTHEHAKPWMTSGVARAIDDPFVHQHYGDLWIALRSAIALTEAAEGQLQQAWERGDALTADERGRLAVTIYEAKLVAARAALEVTSKIFEVMGARATAAKYGFDRFWRNVRVHTLHDSLDYKLKDVGSWVLTGTVPAPSIYS